MSRWSSTITMSATGCLCKCACTSVLLHGLWSHLYSWKLELGLQHLLSVLCAIDHPTALIRTSPLDRAVFLNPQVWLLLSFLLTSLYKLNYWCLICQEMATHSSIFVWKIPWMEEPGGLQSMGLQRVRGDWSCTPTFHNLFLHIPVNISTTWTIDGTVQIFTPVFV